MDNSTTIHIKTTDTLSVLLPAETKNIINLVETIGKDETISHEIASFYGETYIDRASQDNIDDFIEMGIVAENCFPEGNQDLEFPKELQVLVLRNIDNGIVGYVIYSDVKKVIISMAVLPEYRKDENMSSMKLLSAIKEQIAEKWEAREVILGVKVRFIFVFAIF